MHMHSWCDCLDLIKGAMEVGGPAAQLATYENSSGLNIPQSIHLKKSGDDEGSQLFFSWEYPFFSSCFRLVSCFQIYLNFALKLIFLSVYSWINSHVHATMYISFAKFVRRNVIFGTSELTKKDTYSHIQFAIQEKVKKQHCVIKNNRPQNIFFMCLW